MISYLAKKIVKVVSTKHRYPGVEIISLRAESVNKMGSAPSPGEIVDNLINQSTYS